MKLIDKDALVAEITHKIKVLEAFIKNFDGISDKVEKAKNKIEALGDALLFIENLEVKEFDMPALDNGKMSVERWKEACKAACSDENYRSHYGFTETRDDYFIDGVQWADEHPEVKEVDLEKEMIEYFVEHPDEFFSDKYRLFAQHFFELGTQQLKNDNDNEEKK